VSDLVVPNELPNGMPDELILQPLGHVLGRSKRRLAIGLAGITATSSLRTVNIAYGAVRLVRSSPAGSGRTVMQVRPWVPGFRAEAHTISGPASVWAGELCSTLAEATDDAIAMIAVLRHEG